MDSSPSRALWRLLEPLHAVTYFSPEPLDALRAAGYRGFWMGYFAGRAAPLGAVGPDVVEAVFANFAPARVARALPAAWDFAPPAAALAAREQGSAAALRRVLGEAHLADRAPVLEVAVGLLEQVVAAAPVAGRPLFAANRAVPAAPDPLVRLWQLATLLREHRGDGHVAALVAAGVGGRESHVLHALATDTPAEVYRTARDFDDAEWQDHLRSLGERGWVREGRLTAEGRAAKAAIEQATDLAADPPFAVLAPAELAELRTLLHPLAGRVAASGDLPLDSPMGLDLRTLGGR